MQGITWPWVPDRLNLPAHHADGTAAAQASRQGVSQPPNRLPMEQLLLSHRAANGVSERLLLDIVRSPPILACTCRGPAVCRCPVEPESPGLTVWRCV